MKPGHLPRVGVVLAGSALIVSGFTPVQAAAKVAHADQVTIKRDTYGVPHVYAKSTRGLFRGYGYAVAQDRLFQMEMSRRSTQGTVAEVLGTAYVALDTDTRSGFDPGSIRRQVAALPTQDRDILEGYAEGMNRHLDEITKDPSLLPEQFSDYGFAPSRWTAYDIAMVWVGTMANRYSDTSEELPNYALLQQLIDKHGTAGGQRLFNQMMWTEDPLAPTTVPRTGRSSRPREGRSPHRLAPLSSGIREVGDEMAKRSGAGDWPEGAPRASNLWMTGAKRSAGAQSILLNGPQFSWFNPSYVFGIGLHGAGWDFAGSTPFAYPSVIFGSNKTISWGATAGPMNVVDMYQEQLNPTNHRQYMYNGKYRKMQVRPVKIKVKNADDVTVNVLRTVHGFVTALDADNDRAYSKKRSWSGHEVESMIAWAKVPKAKNFNEFSQLASKFAISINWYYADKRGNIGYISPGKLPNRPANQDFRVPAIGDGTMEWNGYAPFEDNPMTYNPKQGFIANWNNEPAPGFNNDYGNWSVVDRSQEIVAALEERKKFTPEQIWKLNERFSFADLNLRYLAPTLAEAVRGLPKDNPMRRDVQLLTGWDGQTRDRDGDGSYDGPQPAIMRAWLPLLFSAVLADDLPESVYKSYVAGIYAEPIEQRSLRPAAALKLVYNGILGDKAGVAQTTDFFNGKDPHKVLLATYQQALADLRKTKGADEAKWRTPVAHHQFAYKNFLGVPQANPDEALAGPQYMNRGTANHLAVLSKNENRARLCMVSPPGQSGFVSSEGKRSVHYDDQMEMFANFGCREEHLTDRSLTENLESVTVLD